MTSPSGTINATVNTTFIGNGSQTRTFCYVTDAMVGFMLVILKGVPGESYNIGNPDPEISMLDLAGRVESVIGRPIDIEPVAEHASAEFGDLFFPLPSTADQVDLAITHSDIGGGLVLADLRP